MSAEKFRRARSADECTELIYGRTPEELGRIIFSLIETEKHYTPEEIGELEGMTAQTIRRDIKAGLFGGEYYARNKRQLRVSSSGIAAWRELFKVRVPR